MATQGGGRACAPPPPRSASHIPPLRPSPRRPDLGAVAEVRQRPGALPQHLLVHAVRPQLLDLLRHRVRSARAASLSSAASAAARLFPDSGVCTGRPLPARRWRCGAWAPGKWRGLGKGAGPGRQPRTRFPCGSPGFLSAPILLGGYSRRHGRHSRMKTLCHLHRKAAV